MRINFSKIGGTPGTFRYADEGLSIVGTLLKKDRHLVELVAEIEGEVRLECDRCGESFPEKINIPLKLFLTDLPQRISDNLDTIEFLDGEIDIGEILESEINSFRSSYHYCPGCRESGKEIDMEF